MIMKYPIGIQDFESIINGGYVYVDKTALIYRLVTEGKNLFPQPSTPIWKKSARFYPRSILSRKERTF